jgi:hypothetical protein
MHAKAAIVAGIAVAVLGGGLALAQGDAGSTTRAADVRSATTISRSQAEQTALSAVGGGWVRESELETEEGALVWKVRVIARGVEHDLYVDARTGDVVRHRARRDDAVRHDDDADDIGPRHDVGDDHGGLHHDDGHHHGGGDDHGGPGED